jgi:hypothetical protein
MQDDYVRVCFFSENIFVDITRLAIRIVRARLAKQFQVE